MGSFYLTPVEMLVFDLGALLWLGLLFLAGWYWIVTYRPWHAGWSPRRRLVGSALQGLLGAQVVWGAIFGLSLWAFFPREAPAWLVTTSEGLLYVVLAPFFVAL